MKKVVLLISLITFFYSASAQIIKEHAFDDQASVNLQMIRLETSGQKVCAVNIIDSISYEYIFYNLDYTEFKTISIDLGPLFIIPGYNSPAFEVTYIAENVFDLDNDVDILGHLTYYDNADDLYAQVVIFHENGNTLFESDAENSNAWLLYSTIANSTVNSSLTNTDEGAKLILDVNYFNEGLYSYDVYGLPGSIPSSVQDIRLPDGISGNYLQVYPVPANEFVDMDYKLSENQNSGVIEIVDQQGKSVQKIRINSNKGNVRMPVTKYNNGLYYYKLNTRRGIPRTGKVIIVK